MSERKEPPIVLFWAFRGGTPEVFRGRLIESPDHRQKWIYPEQESHDRLGTLQAQYLIDEAHLRVFHSISGDILCYLYLVVQGTYLPDMQKLPEVLGNYQAR